MKARIGSLLRNLFRKPRLECELDEELRAYIELLTREKIASGMAPDQAARAARMETEMEQVKEEVRDVRAGAWLEELATDLRYGVRVLAKNPGFAVIAALTLALGIGTTTAVFTVVYGILLRPLPFPQPDQIVSVWEVDGKGHRMNFADPNFEDLRAQNRSLDGFAEYAWGIESISGGAQPTRTAVAYVSRDFFPILRVDPALGRTFLPEEQRFGASPAALVSYGYWQQYLGGQNLTTVKLTIEDRVVSVVGVLAPGFRFPEGCDIWIPRELLERLPSRTAHNWHALGRLRDGSSFRQAQAQLTTIARQLKQQYGRDIEMEAAAVAPLREAMTGQSREGLLVLLGAVGFLLLIACANVVNLLLAQAAARERELAIRSALGAERRRIVKQFLTEALVLALIGGALGVLAAFWGVRALIAVAPRTLPRIDQVSLNMPVLLFALGVSLLVALALGVVTALRATSADPQQALAQGSRAEAGTTHSHRFGRALVSAQVSITLVLLVGAGLLGRSLLRVLSIDPGFRTEHIVTMDLALPPAEKDAEKLRRRQFLDVLFARLRLINGVTDVGGTSGLPLGSDIPNGTYVLMNPQDSAPKMQDLERLFHETTRTGNALYSAVTEGYFRTLDIPLLRGRLFDERDGPDAPHVAIISESLAREKWPQQDALGRTIEFGNMDGDLRLLTVVGVVGDVRASTLESPPEPTIYVNYRQRPQATRFTVVMQTTGSPGSVAASARDVAQALDPNLPPKFSTFTQVFARTLQTRRFNLVLVGVFAATALLLAMAGIYGVMAYVVSRRTREFGVRMALGATGGDVLSMVLGQGIRTTAIGVVIGIAGACALTRTMRSMLFGVSATDPLTFAGVAMALGFIAALACYIPARRATRVDPMVALRYE